MNKDYEQGKMELWIRAWVACCSASNCNSISVPAKWADRAVKDFEERFKKEKADEE